MANLPVRGLGKPGIARDPAPYDLPPTAWSGGKNVWFADNKALRTPGFRTVNADISADVPTPAGIACLYPTSGPDLLFVMGDDDAVFQYNSGSLTDVSETGFSPATPSDLQFTDCALGGVLYINRETRVPRYWGPNSSQFEELPAWDADWRCGSLRAYKDFLMALNVTKGAVEYPTMVKWSNAATFGNTPNTWDETVVVNNLAGENVLAEMDGPLIDGCTLQDSFILYGQNQVWAADFTGSSTNVFAWRKLFSEGGIINRNCVVEVDGKHYVFGQNDIYWHDGVTKQSLVQGLNKDYIFKTMNRSEASKFFVRINRATSTIHFCYVSGDSDTDFPSDHVNRAFVLNYTDGSQGFMEMPNTVGMVNVTISSVDTWTTIGSATWEQAGGAWLDQDDGDKRALVSVSRGLTGGLSTPRLHAIDPIERNSRVSLPLDTEATTDAYLERIGIDLDEVQLPIDTFKSVRFIKPQCKMFGGASLMVKSGASSYEDEDVTYGDPLEFAPRVTAYVGSDASGRYLAIHVAPSILTDFELTGFDIDVIANGLK